MGSIGRLIAGLLLVGFAGVGIASVLRPDRLMGAWLTAWNRLGVRIAGALFTGLSIYMLYHLIAD
jgi:hypothetical protein